MHTTVISSFTLPPVAASAPASILSARFCGLSGLNSRRNSYISVAEGKAEVMPSLIKTIISPFLSCSLQTVGRRLSNIPSGRLWLSKILISPSRIIMPAGEPILTKSAAPVFRFTAAMSMHVKRSSRLKESSLFIVFSTVPSGISAR